MVITFEKIFRDAIGSYPHPDGYGDVDYTLMVNWINESYVEMRNEFIKNRQHEPFGVEEEVAVFTTSRTIPYMNVGKLKQSILQSFPLKDTLIYVVCRLYPRLSTVSKSWQKGDKVYIGTDLYQAVSDVPEMDSISRVFIARDVRNYSPANGLRYSQGDIIVVDEQPYRALQTHEVDYNEEVENLPALWEPVYWKRIGIGFSDPEVIAFSKVDRKKSAIDAGASVITFNNDQVYVSKNVRWAKLQYIPDHKYVRGFTGTFTIPDGTLTIWRSMIHERMLRSKGALTGEANES